MKKVILVFSLFIALNSFSQVPQGINYQAAIRNTNGLTVNNANVGIRMNILQGSPSGTVVYSETFLETTSNIGLVNFVIGQGTPLAGTFSGINWGTGPYFLEVAADETGGSNYAVIGTQQMMSVPYALYAENSGTPGPQGLQGIQGLTGPAGAQGIPGTDGLDGAVGATGPQGPIGLTGPQGSQGIQGLTGPAGTNGIDGAVGATGPQGPIGLTGPQGPQGIQGLTGPAGANGIDGAVGATGPQGPIGLTGPQGLQGIQGLTGPTGTNGIDGAVGATGPQGPIGLTGSTGAQGPIGLTGIQGLDGQNGLNALIKTTSEAAGANCTNGGTKIETGLDANGNGVLDVGEVNASQTKYVCNGAQSSLTNTENNLQMIGKLPLGSEGYCHPGWRLSWGSIQTWIPNPNNTIFFPIYISKTTTFSGVSIHLASASNTPNAVLRAGIYSWNNGYPDQLIQDFGTMIMTTTGLKSINSNITLDPGYYFLAAIGGSGNGGSCYTYHCGEAQGPVTTPYSDLTNNSNGRVTFINTTSTSPTTPFPQTANISSLSNSWHAIPLFLKY